jgi:hypothetical protein
MGLFRRPTLKTRHKNSELLPRLQLLTNLDVMKKIVSLVDITTVSHASKRTSRIVARGLACRVGYTEVIIRRVAFRDRKDGNLIRFNWDLERRCRGLLYRVLVVEYSCGICQ